MLFVTIVFFYVLSGQTYLSNDYLMPCLERISQKWGLSETGTGILMALGMSVPELTTNLLSSFKTQMIGYGFGTIVGSGVFDFTICFGLMSLFSNYYHGRALKMKFKSLLRDIYVYLLTLLFLTFVFWDYQISLIESLLLTLLYPSYLIYSILSLQEEEMLSSQRKIPSLLLFGKHLLDEDENLDGEEIGQEIQIEEIEQEPNKLLLPFKILFKYTIPINSQPELSFTIISIYFFLCVNLTMLVVDEFVESYQVSVAFVGLTIASWGGNISDVLNASIAAKNKKTELATSSIIGSQILNLQICLGLPWLLSILIHQENIIFYDETISTSMFAIMSVVLLSFALMVYQKLRLTYKLGILLLLIYMIYFIFEVIQQ